MMLRKSLISWKALMLSTSALSHHHFIATSFVPVIRVFSSTRSISDSAKIAYSSLQSVDYDENESSQTEDEWNSVMDELSELSSMEQPIQEEDDDDFEGMDCLPPGRQTKHIYTISDSTGVTAKSTLLKCLAQFGSYDERFKIDLDQCCNCQIQTKSFTFVREEEAIRTIVGKASALTPKAFVMFTISDPVLREKIKVMCNEHDVPVLDLLGPALMELSSFLGMDAIGTPGLRSKAAGGKGNINGQKKEVGNSNKPNIVRGLSDFYYRRIESIEFTLKADDGQAPWLLSQADVILVGVSRTGKTPLSVLLSQTMGLKVANVPLVLECPPPTELVGSSDTTGERNSNKQFIDSKRVFCLTIAPSELRRIRTTRLERSLVTQIERRKQGFESSDASNSFSDPRIGSSRGNKSSYNDRAYLMNDLKNARDLAVKHNWTEIDVTGRAVEETASLISELMNERFENDIFNI